MCGLVQGVEGRGARDVPIEQPADYGPRYNIAPSQRQQIARTEFEEREALRSRWGLQGRPISTAWLFAPRHLACQLSRRCSRAV